MSNFLDKAQRAIDTTLRLHPGAYWSAYVSNDATGLPEYVSVTSRLHFWSTDGHSHWTVEQEIAESWHCRDEAFWLSLPGNVMPQAIETYARLRSEGRRDTTARAAERSRRASKVRFYDN